MKLQKIKIIAPIAHFGIPYTSKNRMTHRCPPPSTVIGILRNIYGFNINNFKLGYTFKYDTLFEDLVKKYKVDIKNQKPKNMTTDACSKEYLFDTELIIYTDIKLPINMFRTLTLGQADSLAKIEMPIQEIELVNKQGIGYGQYTPINIGTGHIIPMLTAYTKYNSKLGSYDSRIISLRFNNEFNYDKNFDEDDNQNIFIWSIKGDYIYAD